MKKKVYAISFFLLLLGIESFAVSCSSDDKEEQRIVLDIDTAPAQDYNGICIDFKLLNSDSVAIKTFKEGENILFNLEIENRRDTVVYMPTVTILAEDMFHVYSAYGRDYGKPWDWLQTGLAVTLFFPKTSKVFCYSWLGEIDTDPSSPDERQSRHSFANFRRASVRAPLPKGDYFTQFEMEIDGGKKIVCRKDFKVI